MRIASKHAGPPVLAPPASSPDKGANIIDSLFPPEPWELFPQPRTSGGMWREVYRRVPGAPKSDDARRVEGDGPSGNAVVDATFDNLGIIDGFLRTVLRRNGIDDADMPLRATVWDTLPGANRQWVEESQSIELQGIGRENLGFSLDGIAHEAMHGVIAHVTGLGSSIGERSIKEGWSDVLAVLARQRSDDPVQFASRGASGDDWTYARVHVERDLANPRRTTGVTSFAGLRNEFGGSAHENGQLAGHAAYLAARALSGSDVARIWYQALRHIEPGEGMADAADATIIAAGELFGHGSAAVEAVEAAWRTLGHRPVDGGG